MRRAFPAILIAAAALTACSSSSGSSAAEDDVRAAVKANVDAVNSADVSGMRKYTSARCLKKQTDDERRQTAELVNTMYGKIILKDISVSDLSDTRAKVNASTGIEALDKDDSGAWWVKESGSWKSDDC